jgi:uncharacterized protein
MGMMLEAPLSDQEIDAYLESDAAPDECMDITALDGLFTAVAIGPGLPLPSTWMPAIWGGKGEPAFDSGESSHRIVGLMLRRMNEIGARLGLDPPVFDPILLEGEAEGGGLIILAHDWCAGFMAGVELFLDDWRPLVDDPSNCIFLLPFVKLGTAEGAMRSMTPRTHATNTTDWWARLARACWLSTPIGSCAAGGRAPYRVKK